MANPLRAVVFHASCGDKLACGHWVNLRTSPTGRRSYTRSRRCPFCGENKTEAVIAKKLGRRT